MHLRLAGIVRTLSTSFAGGAAALLIAGCGGTSYATPNAGANLRAICPQTAPDAPINEIAARRPMALLPTAIASVRIQAPGYWSRSAETYGEGNYCVISTREVESNVDL